MKMKSSLPRRDFLKESCLQCGKLAGCDKELWVKWPDFKKQIDKLQQDYVAAGRCELS